MKIPLIALHLGRFGMIPALLVIQASALMAEESIGLAGEWRFALDREDRGIDETWFDRDLSDHIQLPGILQAQGYGDAIGIDTPWVLSLHDRDWYLRQDYQAYTNAGHVKVPFLCQPKRHYLGVAWYQRNIQIPAEWQERRVVLFLERTRWQSSVWVDHREVGSCNSLVAPHQFDLGVLTPGTHRLSVRVDNRMLMKYRPDAHAVSDSLGSTWNGIVGQIELRSTPLVWIEDLQIHPDLERRSVRVLGSLGNATGTEGTGNIHFVVTPRFQPASDPTAQVDLTVRWTTQGGPFEVEIPLGPNALLWNEFNPRNLYRLSADLNDEPHWTGTFGLRDFRTKGREFVMNGRPTHLRGTHHGGDFPLTGSPPCEVDYWLTVWQTCKDWGLNHVRFHSFCPPEAAFTAADQVGLYLQIEPGMWNEISPDTPMEDMLYAETERILKAYGNHPSFVLMSASNEAKGRWKEALPRWVQHCREADPRHLYTPDTGWSLIDNPQPVADKVDYLAVHRVGRRMMRGASGWFGKDYSKSYEGVDVPNIVHENGQWCAYPDYAVIEKFKGYLRPGNFEIFRDSLAAHRLATRNSDFAWASGRFQLACYKEEVEANLRTPGLGGFQLLDLHDYVGQGTALVGVLDPFWEEKRYVNAEEWQQFCSPVVPLTRLTRRVFTTSDTLEVPVEMANFGVAPLTNALITWQIVDARYDVVAQGDLPALDLALGRSPTLGSISVNLTHLTAPAQYRLVVRVGQASGSQGRRINQTIQPENAWTFWLYPTDVDRSVPADVLLTHSWVEAADRLTARGKVVFQPPQASLDWFSPPLDDVPVFWNRLMNPRWSRMLGLCCDTSHPALAGFPTEANCDWQWTQIIQTRAMNLDRLPRELKPIVSAIDDWNRNWKLGMVFEAKVGEGRLLVSTFDLEADDPVARQLRRSLLDYAASDRFQPTVEVAQDLFAEAWFDNRIMSRLGARAEADGGEASSAIDGDPNTYWLTGAPSRNRPGAAHPHELTVRFREPVKITGLVLMNRQNDRNHQGDIRGYSISVRRNEPGWQTIGEGTLASTWNPQTIRFGKSVIAQHIRLTARSGFGSDPSAALAELAVLCEDAPRTQNVPTPQQFQRIRSTSSDIDEGN